jgi:hypothetical protein
MGDLFLVQGVQLPTRIEQGEALTVGIVWQAQEGIAEDFVLFFHVIDAAGTLVDQDDGAALVPGWTTSHMMPHEPLGWSRTIDLPDDLPPGQYAIYMGAYSYPSIRRLSVADSNGAPTPNDLVPLGSVEVVPSG